MRKIAIGLFLLGSVSQANVLGLFDLNKGIYKFIIQGAQGDADAAKLFELLNVEAIETNDQYTKTASYIDFAGFKSFAIKCNISKLISNYGSCTITITNSGNTHVEDTSVRRYLAYGVYHDAIGISKFFNTPTTSAIFYRTSDGKLDLSNTVSPDPVNFVLVFVEKK